MSHKPPALTPRVVLLTANERRHTFLARQVAERLNLVGVVSEAKGPAPTKTVAKGNGDTSVLAAHFDERRRVEAELFTDADSFPCPPEDTLQVPRGQSNSATAFHWIQQREPDALLLFGTSIIRAPLLTAYPNRVVNLHLGLSPYYRGSGTNFWPLVNGEPECVGFTIHLAVLEVDAGAVLWQGRPEPVLGDRAHQLGCKTILEGARALPEAARSYLAGRIPAVVQCGDGRVYRKRDFNAQAVRKMHANFDSGMLEQYLTCRDGRCANFPIIQPGAC